MHWNDIAVIRWHHPSKNIHLIKASLAYYFMVTSVTFDSQRCQSIWRFELQLPKLIHKLRCKSTWMQSWITSTTKCDVCLITSLCVIVSSVFVWPGPPLSSLLTFLQFFFCCDAWCHNKMLFICFFIFFILLLILLLLLLILLLYYYYYKYYYYTITILLLNEPFLFSLFCWPEIVCQLFFLRKTVMALKLFLNTESTVCLDLT